MNTKRLKEYLQEIDRLKKLDWNTSIKINQEFKDRKEAELKNFRLDQDNFDNNFRLDQDKFDNRLLNYINNLKQINHENKKNKSLQRI